MVKVQLVSNKLGTINCSVDPEGIDKMQEQIKRSTDNDGVIYSFSTALKFEKIGREFLRRAYLIDGIQALVVVNIYEVDPKSHGWFLSSTGKVNFSGYELDEISVTVNLEEFNFNVLFKNQIDKDVSMSSNFCQDGVTELPPMTLVDVKLQPKSILKEYLALPSETNDYVLQVGSNQVTNGTTIYGVLDTQNLKVGEIETSFGYMAFMSSVKEDATDLNLLDIKEAGTIDTINLKGQHNFKFYLSNCTAGDRYAWHTCDYRIRFKLLHRDSLGATITETTFKESTFQFESTYPQGNPSHPNYHLPISIGQVALQLHETDIDYDEQILNTVVSVGDQFVVYYEIVCTGLVSYDDASSGIYYNPDDGGIGILGSAIELVSDHANTSIDFRESTTFPETVSKGVMVYELCERLCQFYTNQLKCFKSTALGRIDTTIPYDADGIAALIAYTNGWAIRKNTDHQLFFNFKEVMQSLSSTFALGWGFETQADGSSLVVVEELPYFFNKNMEILDMGEVPNVKIKALSSKYYQTVMFGYRDLKQIKQINAVDEFNQGRKFSTPITQVDNSLDLTAGKISASGYEIENQRRQSSTTTNSPLDEDRFMICVLRDGVNWKNERAEAFSEIANLYDPSTAYNLRIRPSKCARRWDKILASNIIYGTNKILTFQSGTGNYNLVCKGADDTAAFAEKDNIDLTGVSAIWVNESYDYSFTLSREDWQKVKSSYYGYIEFKNKGKIGRGLITNVAKNKTTHEVTFELLKVFIGK